MTIFGVPWNEVQIGHIRDFFDDAGPEPLLWEAKGTSLVKDEIRVQVCGFANSHDGGYLILGASESGGRWELDGLAFPADPPAWISEVVGNAGVTPYPDGLDTRAFPVDDGRYVAVVKVPPVATPPCNTGGRVFERVSGRTVPVREPLRLATLFEGGDQARRLASARSRDAATDALTRGTAGPDFDGRHIRFGLGLSASAYGPDVDRRPFTQAFERLATDTVTEWLTGGAAQQIDRANLVWDTNQIARTLDVGPTHPMELRLLVRVTRDGAVGILWTQAVTTTRIESVIDNALEPAWRTAEQIVSGLGARGPRYLSAVFAGAMFPTGPVLLDPLAGLPFVSRGPLQEGVEQSVLAGIARELNRAVGWMVYEEDPV
jgi:hypothetical protein